jgi:hypothetical protein
MGRTEAPPAWVGPFLERYSKEGGISLSAKEAGTTWQTVKAYANKSPEFAERLEEAKNELIEHLERQLVKLGKAESKGNFLAVIARLKGEIPTKYNDKLQVSGVVGHLHAGPPPEVVEQLLRDMVAAARPATLASITGEVIDVTPNPNPAQGG